MKIKLKHLNPNPYKKKINRGMLSQDQVNKIKSNIKELGLMGSIPVSKKNNKYFIVNGHHRTEALKQVYGNNFEVECTEHRYNEEQMLRGMVIENLTQRAGDFREETGNLVILNDLRTAEFEITSRIGADYTSQKEQTLDRLEKTLLGMAPDDPMRKAVQLKIIQLSDGVEMKDLKEFANKQLVISGIKEPETDEEKALLEQAQNAPQEPDAAMTLALAEDKKGQADILNAQREGVKMNLDDENTKTKHQIDMFKAETERMKLQVDAKEVGAKITKTGVDTAGVQLDNQKKIQEIQFPEVGDMSDDELMKELMAG